MREGGQVTPDQTRDELDDVLEQALAVRTAYRLDPGAHPEVAAAGARAAAARGLDVTVTVYQLEAADNRAGGSGPAGNAHLVHAPGEAAVVVSGGLLSLLAPARAHRRPRPRARPSHAPDP